MSDKLPNGWARVTLRELVGDGVFADGDWVESKDQDPAGAVRLIQLADVGTGRFLDRSSRFLTEAKAAELGCTFLERGDVLISRMADPIGRACVFPGVGQRCVTVVDVCIVRPNPDRVDTRWLVSAINSPQFRGDVELAASGTTRSRVSRGNLGNLRLALPPLNEQRRIAAKLEALQARSRRAREALDAVPPLLEKLRQSILAAAFRGDLTKDWRAKNKNVEPATELLKRIRTERRKKWEESELAKMKAKGKPPKDDKWKSKYKEPAPVDTKGLPELPVGWSWASIEACSMLVTDGDHNPPKRVPNGVPHLTAKNVRNHQLRLDGCSYLTEEGFAQTRQRYEPKAGDIIVTCVGTLGETAIVPPNLTFSADRNLAAIRLVDRGITAEIVQYWLNTLWVQKHLGIVSGSTAQPHLYLNDLRALAVPIMSSYEQEALGGAIAAALARVATATASVATLEEARVGLDHSILSKGFRGALVARAPSEEP